MSDVVTAAAVKRLRSKAATHHSGDVTITVLHRHPRTGAALSTTGRLIAETPHEIALLVRSSPTVISTKHVVSRTDSASKLSQAMRMV